MAQVNKTHLQDKLKELSISDNEQTVVSEIIQASMYKNTKSRRYSEDWILLCLLFHMRSPAAYRLLRDRSSDTVSKSGKVLSGQ